MSVEPTCTEAAATEVAKAEEHVEAAEASAVSPSGDRLTSLESRLDQVLESLGHVTTSIEHLTRSAVAVPATTTVEPVQSTEDEYPLAGVEGVETVIVPDMPAVAPKKRNKKKELLRGVLGFGH